ncbi:hypothetical protein phig1ep12 [Lactobacillus phage phig1e]|uniref:hypothetical protein n=1 Tax=Lactobacillus phage phig1e TaxID=52979 RepID=UPI000009B5B0|nr:hypothetical protein phig1ep12 [Lactobacillus phage phig1e]CAA66753.1 Rorf148 [Lactobacillus phage phig1e]
MMSKQDRINRRRRNIMKDAHRIAKLIVSNVGDYMVAMKLALKTVYAYKAMRKEVSSRGNAVEMHTLPLLDGYARQQFEPEFVAGIPAWAIKKDFMSSSAQDILYFTIDTKVVKETEKAVEIEFATKNPKEHGYVDHHHTWVAKSIMAA